jgi:hypothetical protein
MKQPYGENRMFSRRWKVATAALILAAVPVVAGCQASESATPATSCPPGPGWQRTWDACVQYDQVGLPVAFTPMPPTAPPPVGGKR